MAAAQASNARTGTGSPAAARARDRVFKTTAAVSEESVMVADRLGSLLSLQARALSHERYALAATSAAAELARHLKCERVSIGFHVHGRLSVSAISNTQDFRAQQGTVRAIEAAMSEAFDQRTSVVYPSRPGTSAKITLAHAALSVANAGTAVASVPIANRNRVVGVIVFERKSGFDDEALRVAKDATLFIGTVLALQHRADAPIGGRLIEQFVRRGQRMFGRDFALWKLGAVAVIAALVLLALWPVTFRVVAPARVEGAIQRVVPAPIDGFLRSVAVRPGEPVQTGQVIATLEDRDLLLERDKWEAEIAQLDKQYREALTRDDAAQIAMVRARIEQAQSQLGLAHQQLERTKLTAPFDGLLISGDLTQSIGMPVKRGQELLTIAPANQYRVIVEVDEQDIESVRRGQMARVMFAALPDRPMIVEVARLSPIATAQDGRNYFEVEGRAGADAPTVVDGLRPGLRGVAKVEVDERSVFAVYTYRARNWLRAMLWRWLA